MVRTQIYLTEKERGELSTLAESTGKKQAELIREAVDRFIEMTSGSRRKTVLSKAAGMWRDRKDLPDFQAARRSWDRS
jgi:hypothetical protein